MESMALGMVVEPVIAATFGIVLACGIADAAGKLIGRGFAALAGPRGEPEVAALAAARRGFRGDPKRPAGRIQGASYHRTAPRHRDRFA